MTERVLPSAGSRPPPEDRPDRVGALRPAAGERPVAVARPVATNRSQPLLTTPARAGLLLGGSAAAYAVVLAAIAGLQSTADADLAARRQPWVDAVAERRAANDAVEQSLQQLETQVAVLRGDYAGIRTELGTYQARLDALATLVADIEGSAARLPTRIHLPAVQVRVPAGRATRPPATTATTGASGG